MAYRHRAQSAQARLRIGTARIAACGVAFALLSGCSSSSNMFGSSGSGGSFSDRFSQLFGGKSQGVGEASPRLASTSADAASSFDCPPVQIRDGAAALTIGKAGLSTGPSDVQYQLTVTQTARECSLNGGQVLAKVGMQGRLIVGALGAPPQVNVPLRIAVVKEGVTPQTILSKAYTTQVAVTADSSVPFGFVAEDIVFPIPSATDADAYVFYVGFDPEGGKPQRAPQRRARQAPRQ